MGTVRRLLVVVASFICAAGLLAPLVSADEVTISGTISQSTSDGTGPAVNNPSLNSINDGDAFTVTLDFAGSVSSPGTYDLTGGTLVFSDPAASATESAFDAISLSVAPDGGSDDISLLGCLTTGSGCLFGNYLSMNFAIPSGDLNAASAPATLISGLYPPVDLLEDDGTTDIQGLVTTYSYSPPGSTTGNAPEPASLPLLLCGLSLLVLARVGRKRLTLPGRFAGRT